MDSCSTGDDGYPNKFTYVNRGIPEPVLRE